MQDIKIFQAQNRDPSLRSGQGLRINEDTAK